MHVGSQRPKKNKSAKGKNHKVDLFDFRLSLFPFSSKRRSVRGSRDETHAGFSSEKHVDWATLRLSVAPGFRFPTTIVARSLAQLIKTRQH